MNATISHVSEGTIAFEAGLKKGDIILQINRTPVRDVIDYMFYSREERVEINFERDKKEHTVKVKNREHLPLGIELRSFRTKKCRNKCVFCFVHQLPKGLRKPLYLKDDDYRMSFLFGNYITMTNLTAKEKNRIIEQRLSPLYISVHTTNNDLRRKMLGNPKAPDILKELQSLTSHRIRIHAQIVVCPGMNDGEELSRTLKDLQKFYPYVASVAVVPVGLTRFKKGGVRAVRKEDAIPVVALVKQFRQRCKRRFGDPIAYLADEFYLRAELPFPLLRDYGDLSQLENGVGMIPLFLSKVKKLKVPKKIKPTKAAVFTGVSFMPYLTDFCKKLSAIEGLSLDVFKVENRFFGTSVTVAGLLTGKDVLRTIVGKTRADCLLVPNVMLRDGSDLFLDSVSLNDLSESLGMSVRAVDATPEGLLRGIMDECKRQD